MGFLGAKPLSPRREQIVRKWRKLAVFAYEIKCGQEYFLLKLIYRIKDKTMACLFFSAQAYKWED